MPRCAAARFTAASKASDRRRLTDLSLGRSSIGVQLGTLADYAFRENTRYEHSAALQDALGYRPFAGRPRQEIETWLDHAAMLASSGSELAVGLCDELRRRRLIVPAVTTLERLCAAALVRAERKVLHDLAHDLDREQIARLERLLTPRPEGGASWLTWVRQPTEEASAAAFIAIIERLDHVRALGLEAARALRVPRHHLLRLSREAERFSASPLNLVRLAERGRKPRQHKIC